MEIRIEYTFSPIGSNDFFKINGNSYRADEKFRDFMDYARHNDGNVCNLEFLNDFPMKVEKAKWIPDNGSHEYDGKGTLLIEGVELSSHMAGV